MSREKQMLLQERELVSILHSWPRLPLLFFLLTQGLPPLVLCFEAFDLIQYSLLGLDPLSL